MQELYSLSLEELDSQIRAETASMSWPSVQEALDLAYKAHEGQMRTASERPYIVHPIRVALILLRVAEQKNPAIICAGLLHDVLEDSDVSEEEIERKFGSQVLDLVLSLTHPLLKEGETKFERNKKMFENMRWHGRDTHIIKSADRLDNLFTATQAIKSARLNEYLIESEEYLLPLTLASNTALYHALNEAIQKLKLSRPET